jgi:CO/xanthine dehydrogenase FAD-binding subunit
MISFDFEYYKPTTIDEAVQLHQSLRAQKKKPVYYCGGTEITTLGRLNLMVTDAVIDLKGLQECHILQLKDKQLVMGAALSFTRLIESHMFPLLGLTIKEVADHTARSNITLGGNISGQIIYREAVLPLLLTDSTAMVAGGKGTKQASIHQIFNQQVKLSEGEFLVQLMTDQSYLQMPYVSVKKRKQGSVGYPLVTIAALKKEQQIRLAFSGLCSFPFRDAKLEEFINQKQIPLEARIEQVISQIPYPVLDDVEGSAEYRLFVLKNTLMDIVTTLEGEANE